MFWCCELRIEARGLGFDVKYDDFGVRAMPCLRFWIPLLRAKTKYCRVGEGQPAGRSRLVCGVSVIGVLCKRKLAHVLCDEMHCCIVVHVEIFFMMRCAMR